jgi:hypothetical protein
MIICLSFFVVSAYALEVEVFGAYEISGKHIANDNVLKDDAVRNASYYSMDLVIWGRFIIDPKTAVTVRTYPFYHYKLGTPRGDDESGLFVFDRAYITYRATEQLTFALGLMTGNNYDNGFGGGWYDLSFAEAEGRGQLKATYAIDDNTEVFAVVEKVHESDTSTDWDNYLVGAKLTFGDWQVNPTLAFSNFPQMQYKAYSAYVSVDYMPETGFNFSGAGALISGDDGEDNKFSLFGAYLDASYIADNFIVGGLFAYGSHHKNSNRSFRFGGDFDRTLIMDDHLDETRGLPAMTMLQLYGIVNPIDRLSLLLSASYYTSNVSKHGSADLKSGEHLIIGDTRAHELNVIASYALTDSTMFRVGAGYAQLSNICDGADNKFSPNAITMLYWSLLTEF